MSDIPRARALLEEIAADMGEEGYLAIEQRILDAVELLYRRQPARKPAPAQSERLTPSMVRSIRRVAAVRPEVPLQKIATMFGINAGRVSEILQGDR